METLTDPLPENPLKVAAGWLSQAQRDALQPNPHAMVLATVDARGQPSARVVLCKDIDAEAGLIRFYTNYLSRKGRELHANPRAAVVIQLDHQQRQVPAELRVEPRSDRENDLYLRGKPWQSRLGAWASRQSEPLESRAALVAAVVAAARRFRIVYSGPGSTELAGIAVEVPRPPHWGGYRLVVDAVELWVEGDFRIHDRARWTHSGAGDGAAWAAQRLQP